MKLEYMLLSDRAFFDQNMKLSVFDIFYSFLAPSYPATSSFYVSCCLTGIPSGTYKTKFKIFKGKKMILTSKKSEQVVSDAGIYKVIVSIKGFTIPSAGKYTIKLYFGKEIFEEFFEAKKEVKG